MAIGLRRSLIAIDKNYIFAPDGLIAIYENKNGIGKMFYTATDNLGFLFFASALRPAQVSSECKK